MHFTMEAIPVEFSLALILLYASIEISFHMHLQSAKLLGMCLNLTGLQDILKLYFNSISLQESHRNALILMP